MLNSFSTLHHIHISTVNFLFQLFSSPIYGTHLFVSNIIFMIYEFMSYTFGLQ